MSDTVASELETPGRLLHRVYDEEFGFLPVNTSMKPVHVANGLARRLLGRYVDHRPLARVLRQYVEAQRGGYKDERNPNAAVLGEYGERFADRFGNPPSDEALTRFRSLANDTLGADDAVFPTMASFTLSHAGMVSDDVSESGAGDFLAGLLQAGVPDHADRAATLVRQLLVDDTDPWSTLAWPLLDLGEEREAALGGAAQVRADRAASLLAVDGGGRLVSPTLRVLRERFDQLAAYEAAHGSKLATLRRLVLFGAFALHVHMIRRCHEAVPDGPQPPILLDLFDGRRRSLREASAASLQAGFRALEHLVLLRIRTHVEAVSGADPDGFVDALPSSEEWDTLRREYEAQATGEDRAAALAEAFWKVGYGNVGSKGVPGVPWNALLALGRRSGYLHPYDNRGRGGKEHKRYGAGAEFAEILVASTVAPDEPVEFDVFLDRLRDSFGIVVGRPADFDVIRYNDLRRGVPLRRSVSVLESDLRANLLAFRDLVVDIGFAKSYADGRTVVTTDEAAA